MKSRKGFIAGVSWLLVVALSACATEVKVIVNSGVKVDMISPAELKRVFLQQKVSLADGTRVEPVLEKNGEVHQAFLQEYFGMSDDDLQLYYRTLLFAGRGFIPKAFGSDAEVVDYVARTRGAIGYVSNAVTTEGVKTLAVGGRRGVRDLIKRVEPEYPETLKRLSIGGIVRLRVLVSARGSVDDVRVLGGNPILGEAAEIAVRQWVYAAGKSRTVEEVSVPFGGRP